MKLIQALITELILSFLASILLEALQNLQYSFIPPSAQTQITVPILGTLKLRLDPNGLHLEIATPQANH